jgi:D-amino-acid oxidase
MKERVAIIGAGVSGLTCGAVFAEIGYTVSIFAEEVGQSTTSGAAAAIWFPYDAEPVNQVIAWALDTYKILVDLSRDSRSGISMLEMRNFSRATEIQIPAWAVPLGARRLSPSVRSGAVETSLTLLPSVFASGFALIVPLMDTTIYIDYLANRFVNAGGEINAAVRFEKIEDVDSKFDLVINCSGIGAKTLVHDADLEPHRGQVAIVPRINISYGVVCDDSPLMYAIPRKNDCVFGGTNELSSELDADPVSTSRILAECTRVLKIDKPPVLAERVGLRPFRRSGVRVERDRLPDGRTVIHNYGHGGSGFTVSWGCALRVLKLAGRG